MKNVLINRTLCSMVVWRRCSGCWCRTNEGQGSTRVLLQTTPALWDSLACSPALQAHTQDCRTHWFCILEYSVANKQQDCSTPTLSSADKAQSTNSRFWVRHSHPQCARFAPPTSGQHCSISAMQHCTPDTRGNVFRIRKTSIICPGTCFPLIFTQVA